MAILVPQDLKSCGAEDLKSCGAEDLKSCGALLMLKYDLFLFI
jgi:hypothetical protein